MAKDAPTRTRKEAQEARKLEPLGNQFSQIVFLGLQGRPIHEGTEVDRSARKRRNKQARRQRKVNRNG